MFMWVYFEKDASFTASIYDIFPSEVATRRLDPINKDCGEK